MKVKDFVLVVNPRDGFNYGIMERKEAEKIRDDYRIEKSTTFQIRELNSPYEDEEIINFRQMEARLI